MKKLGKLSSGSARVLSLLAVLLVMSALIRIATGPAIAVARDFTEDPDRDVRSDVQTIDPYPEVAALLADLRERERVVEETEAKLEARAMALEHIEKRIRRGLTELEEAEEKLAATMIRAETAVEDDLVRLTSVYENMKPDQASGVFRMMEPSFAAGFLGRMRADSAAAILAGLDAEQAYAISIVLAGRNADVPVEPLPE